MDSSILETKPSRNELFYKHLEMKNKTQKIILKYSQSQAEKWSNHNFKKNPGYKPIWSCGGYGGTCSSCKCIDQSKVSKKREIQKDIATCQKELDRCQS